MKKSLAFLILLSVLSMGMAGALSIVPHTHGNDFDHSKHAACPIYQVGLHGLEAAISSFYSAVIFSLVFLHLILAHRPINTFPAQIFSVRAPPALL